jgi:iron-sulfur cluster repair protein YtfE (RIC family)
MKRHPSLEPFSRDHNIGLVLARSLAREDGGVADAFLVAWEDEMDDHFREEERLLVPLLGEDESTRLRDEHENIRGLANRLQHGDAGVLKDLGRMLDEHIRWEERVMFPLIERTATQAELNLLATETTKLELRRSDSKTAPRRGDLVKQRQVR